MADWFNNNLNNSGNNNEPEKNQNTDSPDNKKEFPSPSSNGNSQDKQNPIPPSNQTQWAAGSTQPASSWNSSTNGNSDDANANNTTYRYGVNAPDPVPRTTEDSRTSSSYTEPGAYTGYQPQGNYDPYGWQQYPNAPGQPVRPVQPGQPGQPGRPGQPGKPQKKKKNGTTIAIATLTTICAVTIIALTVLLATVMTNKGVSTNSTTSSSGTSSSSDGNANAPSLQISSDVDETTGLSTRSIIQKNLDSTVVITVYSNSTQNYAFNTNSSNSESGTASGIIMTADGYIITNWHVVCNESTGKKFDEVDVQTYDGTVYKNAQVIGADQSTDLAVIKIDASNLIPAEFGDSAALQLGDKVVTIGNAGGLHWTTSQGIVSGLARDVYDDTGYSIKCLQIDAAINPGNSGGPLMNSQGKVVGINSAKIVASGYENMGFSIPINEAKTIIEDLTKYGYVKGRVQLGITGQSITVTGYEGFQIKSISSDSCLANTSAQAGDIITYVNDTRVTNYSSLKTELAKYNVGDTVDLTLLRVDSRTGASTTVKVKCTLAEAKS